MAYQLKILLSLTNIHVDLLFWVNTCFNTLLHSTRSEGFWSDLVHYFAWCNFIVGFFFGEGSYQYTEASMLFGHISVMRIPKDIKITWLILVQNTLFRQSPFCDFSSKLPPYKKYVYTLHYLTFAPPKPPTRSWKCLLEVTGEFYYHSAVSVSHARSLWPNPKRSQEGGWLLSLWVPSWRTTLATLFTRKPIANMLYLCGQAKKFVSSYIFTDKITIIQHPFSERVGLPLWGLSCVNKPSGLHSKTTRWL